MPKYKMTIAYDGTPYCGWQVQPNGVSVQSNIGERCILPSGSLSQSSALDALMQACMPWDKSPILNRKL